MSKKKVTKEALIELYINDPSATYDSVAKKLDASRPAVAKAMSRYGLESRNTANKPRVKIPELADKAWLEQKFIEEGFSATEIGKLLNCSDAVVLRKLKKHGIDTQRPLNPLLEDKQWLEEQYITRQRTYENIGNEIGVTKHGVYHAIKRHGIQAREHTSKYSQLNDKEWLRKKYLDEMLSINQLADLIGTTEGNIHSALTHAGVETRGYKEGWATRFPDGRWGKDSANWKDGITKVNHAVRSSNRYKEWRDAIYERDDYTCQREDCRKRNGDGLGYSVVLEADHKKPLAILLMKHDITNLREALACDELWDISNGETLCQDCHKKTSTWGKRGWDKLSEEEKSIVMNYLTKHNIIRRGYDKQ